MGYPNIGNVKTIVLPIPAREMTIDEYKDTYGIDLKDLIFLNDGYIRFKGGRNNTILLDPSDFFDAADYSESKWGLSSVAKLTIKRYNAGEQDALVNMEESQSVCALQFRIDKSNEFSFEHLVIGGIEL